MKNFNQDIAENQAEKQQFYLDYLSKIDCVYNHLAERISELTGNKSLGELKQPVHQLITRAKTQLDLLGHIYGLLGQKPNYTCCEGLVQFLEDNFSRIQPLPAANTLRRAYLFSYMQYTNSLIITSLQLLQLGAESVFDEPVCLQINNLLLCAQKENAILTVVI